MCIEVGWQYAETQLSFHHMRLQRRLSQVLQLKKPLRRKYFLKIPHHCGKIKVWYFRSRR